MMLNMAAKLRQQNLNSNKYSAPSRFLLTGPQVCVCVPEANCGREWINAVCKTLGNNIKMRLSECIELALSKQSLHRRVTEQGELVCEPALALWV